MARASRPPDLTVPPNESDLEEWLRRARIAESACKEFGTKWFPTIDSKVLELLQVERELRSLDLIGLPDDKVPNATQLQRITFIPAVDVLHPGIADSLNAFRHYIHDELTICDERLGKKGRSRRDVDGYRSPEALDFGAPEPGYRGEKPEAGNDENSTLYNRRPDLQQLTKQVGSRRGPQLGPDEEGWCLVTGRHSNGPKNNRRGRRYQHLERHPGRKQEAPTNYPGEPSTPKNANLNSRMFGQDDETSEGTIAADESAERRRKQLVAMKRPDDGGQVQRLWSADKPEVESYCEMLQKDKDPRYVEMLRRENELKYGKVQVLRSARHSDAMEKAANSPYGSPKAVKTADQWPRISPISPASGASWLQSGAGNLPEGTIVRDFAYPQSARRVEDQTGQAPNADSGKPDHEQPTTPPIAQRSSTEERWTQSRLPWKISNRQISCTEPPPMHSASIAEDPPSPEMLLPKTPQDIFSSTNSLQSDLGARFLDMTNKKTIKRPRPPDAISVSNWADEVELEELSNSHRQQSMTTSSPHGKRGYVSSPLRFVEMVPESTTRNAGSQTFANEHRCPAALWQDCRHATPAETRDASTQTLTLHQLDNSRIESPFAPQNMGCASPISAKIYVSPDSHADAWGVTNEDHGRLHAKKPPHQDLVDSITQQYIDDIFGCTSGARDLQLQGSHIRCPSSHAEHHAAKMHGRKDLSQSTGTWDERQHFLNLIRGLQSTSRRTREKLHPLVLPDEDEPWQTLDDDQMRDRPTPVMQGGPQVFDQLPCSDPGIAEPGLGLTMPTERLSFGRLYTDWEAMTKSPEPYPPVVPPGELRNIPGHWNRLQPPILGMDKRYRVQDVFDVPGDSTALHDTPTNGLPHRETFAQTKRAFGGTQLMLLELFGATRKLHDQQEAAHPRQSLKRKQAEWDERVAARWNHVLIETQAGVAEQSSSGIEGRCEPVGLAVHRPVVRFSVRWRLHGGWCAWTQTETFIVQKDRVDTWQVADDAV